MTMFHYLKWGDHMTPKSAESIINLIEAIQKNFDYVPMNSPIIVHCSAGIGRTGTFIAIDTILHKLKKKEPIDVFRTVLSMREDRIGLVQTSVSYF